MPRHIILLYFWDAYYIILIYYWRDDDVSIHVMKNASLTRFRTRCSQVIDEDPRILVRGEEPVVSARRVPRAHTGHVSFPVVVRAPRHVGRRRARLGRSHHRRLAAAHLGQLNDTAIATSTATAAASTADAAVSVSS